MLTVVLAGAGTALVTGLGAVPVILLGDRAKALRPMLYGIAGGVMSVASIVGLLRPALDRGAAAAAAAGLLAGVLFMVVTRRLLQASDLRVGQLRGADVRTAVLVFAVLFAHSLPEGLAIGTAYASDPAGSASS